jgi:glycosyltransferase involved in cell wall biosynthesis
MAMRILLWYWGRRGGGAQFTLGLARALAARPEVRLRLSLSAQAELLDDFRALDRPIDIVETYRGALGFATGLTRLPRLRQHFLEVTRDVDLVVSGMAHLWTPLIVPVMASSPARYVPVVHDASPHPGDLAWGWNWRLRRELQAASAAVALSGSVAAALAERAPGLPLIRMDLPALLATRPEAQARAADPAAIRLLFFGRLQKYKGLDLLGEAFRILRQAHPGTTLRVVGQGDAGAELANLPGVQVERRWVPEPEIPRLLAEADAVVLPYREASQSGIVPQALAMGVPVVATPVGGLLEQVRPGHGGVLADAADAAAFARALATLAEPGRLAALRREAEATGRAQTDWAKAADTLLAGLSRVSPAAGEAGRAQPRSLPTRSSSATAV